MATITIYSPNGTPAASITTDNIEDATNILTAIYETISKETLIYEEAKHRAEPLVSVNTVPDIAPLFNTTRDDTYCPTCQRHGSHTLYGTFEQSPTPSPRYVQSP